MKFLAVLLALSIFAFAKDVIQVEVKAVHQVTHDARDLRAVFEAGGPMPKRQVESFNLDTIINGEHVELACVSDSACEAPSVGSYSGEMKARGRVVEISFPLAGTNRSVKRRYKFVGSW